MNSIKITGRLVADPELKHTQNDTPVCSFNVAVDRIYSKEKETDFFTVVCWRQTAEFVSKYFTKGRMAVIDGRLQLRDWTDRDGNKCRSAEIVANSVNFGDSKPQDQAAPASGYAPAGAPAGGGSSYAVLEDDGDLPF